MEIEYLQQTIGPVLTDAIAKLLQHGMHTKGHMQDPIEFIASYLIQHQKNKLVLEKNEVEHVRIQAIQAQVRQERIEAELKLKIQLELEQKLLEERLEAERIAAELELVRKAAQKAEEERIAAEALELDARNNQNNDGKGGEMAVDGEDTTPDEDGKFAEE